jgi:hypothetical protein
VGGQEAYLLASAAAACRHGAEDSFSFPARNPRRSLAIRRHTTGEMRRRERIGFWWRRGTRDLLAHGYAGGCSDGTRRRVAGRHARTESQGKDEMRGEKSILPLVP